MSTKPSPIGIDKLVFGAVIVILLGIFWYVSGQSQQVLRKSPSGFDGLHHWLGSDGHPVRSFTGGWTSDAATIGLRILPLYDTDLRAERRSPATKAELLAQVDEYDLEAGVLARKLDNVPTLLVLPKWRSGMRLTGLGHPELLIPEGTVNTLLGEVFGKTPQAGRPGNLHYIKQPFTDFPVSANGGSALTARLYVAQVFTGSSCLPLVGTSDRIVLGRCFMHGAAGGSVLVLSDPDLLNNHGLRLGDNAQIAKDILLDLAGDKPVMIDYSTGIWVFDQAEPVERERTWSDLAQFFKPPFTLLWISMALMMALTLWRAGLRYGPVTRAARTISASKIAANSARARLMRLTGQDGALVADYTKARLTAVAARYLAPEQSKDPDAALRFINRKRPDLAAKLENELALIDRLPAYITADTAIDQVDRIELILEQLDHDT